MEYTVIINSRSYDLPKKNLKVMEKLDEVLKIDSSKGSIRQKFEKLHRFVKDTVGEENAKEIFGSDILDEIDTSELSLAVLKINDAYEQPVTDYQMEKMRESMNAIPTEKLATLGKTVQVIAEAGVK